MTLATTYNIAIVGTGGIAGFHALAIRNLPNARLVAVCGRDDGRTSAFAETHQAKPFTVLSRALDELKPDVLCVTTPSGAHLEPVLAAAERGIHVICEKPLEITPERIQQMIHTCQASNVILGAIFQMRMSPLMQEVYQAAKAGRFGDRPTINFYVPWWRDDDYYAPNRWQGTLALDGGGALMNQSIHGVDMVQWLAGAADTVDGNPVEEVFAYTAQNAHSSDLIEVEDTAILNLRFRTGGLGQILAATSMYPGSLRRLQMAGRDGMVEILEDQVLTWSFRSETEHDTLIREHYAQETTHGGGAADPLAMEVVNHQLNIATVLDAIEKKSPLLLNGQEASKAVDIIFAAYRSAKTRCPVRLSS